MRACALGIPEPFNPGIFNQLFRDDLAISIQKPSSSKPHRHKSILISRSPRRASPPSLESTSRELKLCDVVRAVTIAKASSDRVTLS
jgi:hypothetical protein